MWQEGSHGFSSAWQESHPGTKGRLSLEFCGPVRSTRFAPEMAEGGRATGATSQGSQAPWTPRGKVWALGDCVHIKHKPHCHVQGQPLGTLQVSGLGFCAWPWTQSPCHLPAGLTGVLCEIARLGQLPPRV